VPTINVGKVPAQKLLPPDGVYAVKVETRHGCFGGMMNQGGRPTFDDAARTLEAHLFGFAGDLYGERVRLTWVTRLRDIRRFQSADDLAAQLAQDGADARAALARVQRKP
jgi:riboflavin kinase/FMN adenylyltransferase